MRALAPEGVFEGQQPQRTTYLPPVQSELSQLLADEFDVERAVVVSEGVPGMVKATLLHPSGRHANAQLHVSVCC
jgi:hypothetical protein